MLLGPLLFACMPWFLCLPCCPLPFNPKPKSCWARPRNRLQFNPEDALSKNSSSGQRGGCHIPQPTLSSTNSRGEITHKWIRARTGAHSLPWKQVKGHFTVGIVSEERLWRAFKSSSLVGKLKVRKVAHFELALCSREKMPPPWAALVWSTPRC